MIIKRFKELLFANIFSVEKQQQENLQNILKQYRGTTFN